MPSTHNCEQCGAQLPVPGASCPRCLLALGARPSTPPHTSSPHTSHPAPTIEELAPLFPGLELEGVLGRGGMGIVYKARQRDLDRHVALKVLSHECTSDPTFAERFEREARLLARISHPNVVQIFDAGRSGDRYWLMMELVDGTTLRSLIQAQEISPRESLAIVTQICDALQYAHDEGVVHRDIKPENILVDRSGKVKIADFGLAKLIGRETGSVTLTRSDQAMGTLQYMAPEQIRKPLAVDHRADIYSLGVVLYELLTGDLPMGNFPLPSDKVGIDVRLDEVVLRSLEREPERRYQLASEVKVDVERASSGNLRESGSVCSMSESDSSRTDRRSQHGDRKSRKRWPWILVAGGCCSLVLVPLLLLLFFGAVGVRQELAAEAQAYEDSAVQSALDAQTLRDLLVEEEAKRVAALFLPAMELRTRQDKLAEHGRVPSGLLATLRSMSRDGGVEELERLRSWVATLEVAYRKVELQHILAVNYTEDGGARVHIDAFVPELLELQREFRTGLLTRISRAELSEVEAQALMMQAFPFGWSETQIEIVPTTGGWSWSEQVFDTAGETIWSSDNTASRLPTYLARFTDRAYFTNSAAPSKSNRR